MPRPANPKTAEGRAIAEAITRAGLTQALVAERLEVTPSFISQFSTGLRPVPWDKAEALADVLGLQPQEVSAEYARLMDSFGTSQVARLNADIVVAAIAVVRKALDLATGETFDVEQSPDLFAQALRVALAADLRKQGKRTDGSRSGDGQASSADRAARAAEVGREAQAHGGRKRKAG
ncbi:helix-turn-helix domain-containing protein [Stenotrophomonas maltophilia group sp. CASM26]|uniref:helix-turn-helix domain-containing protein n=1 Tax=Stenotrophomonas maltophilia group sp. CASM26 TaxID=3111514 RepID=UPI000B418E3F|nr:XRE family transcriptional regulator [Stenotrophomonas maltophilia]MBH1489769.1 helix-turn-helix transcriptional regulator [Stenotrophomonas maltophilia]MBH1510777.1 helix-turn-helix transcriptional regulator [Stenotrophomonas maltophilia]MBH1544504.1 helix-turn-helix transcriptional regulator [Stenotrophomonas maltophilia]MBH1830459.1 helix-turn-helix transcriptional regulator [Stenotrophomonas maltophilia]